MVSAACLTYMENFCTIVDRELIKSLNDMRADLKHLDPDTRSAFKSVFLKNVNYRLSTTYKYFELTLLLDEQFNVMASNLVPFVLPKGGPDMTKPPPQFNRSNENFVVKKYPCASNSTNVNNSSFACVAVSDSTDDHNTSDRNKRKLSYPNMFGGDSYKQMVNDRAPKTSRSNEMPSDSINSTFDSLKATENPAIIKQNNRLDKPRTQKDDLFEFNESLFRSDHNGTLSSDSKRESNEIISPRATSDTKVIKKSFSKREWLCFYCAEIKRRDVHNFTFSEINDLHKHWNQEHSDRKQFRFCSIDLLKCQIGNYNYYSTFESLKKHYGKSHPKQPFVPILNGRCALCLCDDNDMSQHSCPKQLNSQSISSNPILYTNNDIDELQSIHNPKVKCMICDEVFECRKIARQHHHQCHKDRSMNYESVEQKQVAAIICGHCNSDISQDVYAEHLKKEAHQLWIKGITDWDKWMTNFEKAFMKTKVIFMNGLVVSTENLLACDISNYDGFKKCAREMFDELTEQAKNAWEPMA